MPAPVFAGSYRGRHLSLKEIENARSTKGELRALGLGRLSSLRRDSWRARGIVEHNRVDLLSLVALVAVLARVYAEPGHRYADPLAIARAHRRSGD
jgi:hypothetical protein